MRVSGKTVDLRLVELDDAPFILQLRLDDRLNRFLSPVQADLDRQIQWLRDYKQRERQGLEYYFILEGKQQERYGTVRVYDFQGDSFSWGSWIVAPGSPSRVAMESALLVYRFAFDQLGFTRSHFEVRRENARVVAFHQRFGAQVVDEDESFYYFHLLKADFQPTQGRYERMLK